MGLIPPVDKTLGGIGRYAVPAGSRIYAIGDIHGRLDLLTDLHNSIRADATAYAGRRVVVYLGDYVDRGPDSKSLINYLIEFPLPDFEVYHLKGNHECAFMDFLDANLDLPSWSPRRIPKGLASWLLNGGGSTLASYGIALAPDANQRAVVDAIGQLQKAIPDRHQAFLSSLILSHVEGDYHFVHAGVRPGVDWAEQDDHDLCWIREEFLETDEDFGYCVVHGHTIAEEPIVRRNRIGIDTGASQSGRLTCVVLEENKYHFIQT